MAFECTGIIAGYCPIHGDCTCKDPDDKNNEDCPLHSSISDHGDPEIFETIWGTFVLSPE